MRCRWMIAFILANLSASIFVAQFSAAGVALHVNETATKVWLRGDLAEVSLAMENASSHTLPVRLDLEWLDPQDQVCARAERSERIKPGSHAAVVPMPRSLTGLTSAERKSLLWHRLRYRVRPESSVADMLAPIEGIISLSEIMPDYFELRVAAAEHAREGTRHHVRVRALHPISLRPAKGVHVQAEARFDAEQDNLRLKAAGVTDSDGYVVLNFDLPRHIESDEGTITFTERRGGFLQEEETPVRLDHQARIMISTDKPLYQPGQTLHVRALVFSPSQRAVANARVILSVNDPEYVSVFRIQHETSRFGIVGADWPIPENIRLGDYIIRAEIDDETYENSQAEYTVKISRYELPNFTVTIKPDRTYYLPNQNAEVEVRADYLFGQPVTHGHVRVVREASRQWNYREQKWDIEEEEKYEGETDASGRFVAHVDLTEPHNEMAKENYSRFRDLSYAAYFMDATTGRTEQRRFKLRVTKETIHVYVITSPPYQAQGLPFEFYLSTFYADGTPAACEVAISERFAAAEKGASEREQWLRSIVTNRYGLAKVRPLTLGQRAERGQDVLLSFTAADQRGATGHHTEPFSKSNPHPLVRVSANKSLYRAGEPIEVEITASEPDMTLVMNVAQEWKVIRSQVVRLRKGRAAIYLPYSPEFKGEITISAYDDLSPGFNHYSYSYGARTVLYPHDRELKLDVRSSQVTYRPGDEAQVDVRVRTADGQAVEGALGVVVFDKAVEARARTDQEFGVRYGFYGGLQYPWNNSEELAGVRLHDLYRLDLSKPLPEGLELLAEVILLHRGLYLPPVSNMHDETDLRRIFAPMLEPQLMPIREALATRYASQADYPVDEPDLRRRLAESGIHFDQLRDPWGTPYRTAFTVQREKHVFKLLSAGADKRFGTDDDFVVFTMDWSYFQRHGDAINRAVDEYHARTGGFIRDSTTLKAELLRKGIDFDALRDAWGQPYALQFGVSGPQFTVSVRSGGPNRRFDKSDDLNSDDFTIWTARINYFAELSGRISTALDGYFRSTKCPPENQAEWRDALERSGMDPDSLRDPWGRPYYLRFIRQARYSDRVVIQTRANDGGAATQRTTLTPVTQQVLHIYVHSVGEDGKQGTADDFEVARFLQVTAEQMGLDQSPQPVTGRATLSDLVGAISGAVTDPTGAALPGVTVTATHASTSSIHETVSNEAGAYLLPNLPYGSYQVRFDLAGFQSSVVAYVPVRSSSTTILNAMLQVGTVDQLVVVQAETSIQGRATTQAMLSVNVATREERTAANLSSRADAAEERMPMATPRLREDFPETLLWQPALETDRRGRAQLKFRLADSITTWKLAIIGSTVSGEIGTAEKELRAFQPFFIEHDPPRVLTEGDEIALPIVLRNYLDKAQAVDLEIKPEGWFKLLEPARKRAQVAAGDSVREIFQFHAVTSVARGKQRVTATGPRASDAVEKTVSVHPDGEEVAQTTGQIFGDAATLDVSIPDYAMAGTARAELKIYPNLMAHAFEGIEGILQRPYGCAEQIISSTYLNLIVLRYLQRVSEGAPPVAVKARRYVQAGYERLLGYRAEGGGFSYWGRGAADLALTAHALKFLKDASEFVTVDETVTKRARVWLIGQQRPDGSWPARNWQGSEDERGTHLLTAYITRVLAAMDAGPDQRVGPAASPNAVTRALAYLASRVDEIDEPYLIASYTLAALDAGGRARAGQALVRLRALAHDESDASYWHLESNTPFYGWGLAGRVETTALAMRALVHAREPGRADLASDPLVYRALRFLLRHKDRYGVWYSTQATVNVLDALLALDEAASAPANAGGAAEVLVNGRHVTSVVMPDGHQLSNPITVELSTFLAASGTHVEIRRSAGQARASAQIVVTYYVPWSKSEATVDENFKPGATRGLRLAAHFDKSTVQVGEEVTCTVAAERAGARGYGMLLAEIGLPPGAEVDRASLDQAMSASGWEMNRYDVLPDRLVVYLWPRAGGTRFQFKFRPRFGLIAKSAPSLLYDYYNPEARAVLAPAEFVVK